MTRVKPPFDISAVDLFCGVGGLTHGLKRKGVKVKAGVDIDPTCRYPYEANNKARFVESDVNNIDPNQVERLWGDRKERQLRLLAGCAPCQPFSTYSRSGRGQKTENNWKLVSSFGSLVQTLQPDLVTMENVPQLMDHEVFGKFLSSLHDYHKIWRVIECSTIGVPQSRKRLVLIASRLSDRALELDVHAKRRRRTVRDTIAKLPPISAGDSHPEDPMHASCSLSPLNLMRIQASSPGGTWRDWDDSLLTACHGRASGETYPSVYGRMEWDKESPTMTTQCFGYGNGRFGHPEQDRAISLREAAMLQTFPRKYKFIKDSETVKFNNLGRLIGNAVPVRLGEFVAEKFFTHLEAHYSDWRLI